VHEALHTGGSGSANQRSRVLDRTRKRRVSVLEADPVRVVERRGAAKTVGQRGRVVETKGEGLNAPREITRRIGVAGERSYPPSPLEQPKRDRPAGIRKRSCDDVEQSDESSTIAPLPRRLPAEGTCAGG